MTPRVRLALRLCALVVVMQAVFLGLLVVGAAVPDAPIVDQLSADVRSGAYGPSGLPDGVGGRGTTFTDCVAAGTGVGGPDTSVLERAIRMPRLESCADGAGQILLLHRGGRLGEQQEYFRYWAGYTVLSKPVLAMGGMDGIRLVAGGLFGLALLALAMTVARELGTSYVLALLAPLLLSSNVLTVPANAFSHALSLAVIFAGVALTTWATRWPGWSGLYAVAASACVFNFIDLLTTPTIPLALTAAVTAAVCYRRTASVASAARTGVVVSTVWTVAYVTTWVSRWLITAVFLGWEHTMSVVSDTARFRIDGDYGSVSHTFGAAVLKNGQTWLAVPVMPEVVLVIALLASVLGLAVAWRRNGAPGVVAALVLSAPALIPVVWMLVLSNHSQIHAGFVYRNVPTSIGIVVAACLVAATTSAARPTSAGRHVDDRT